MISFLRMFAGLLLFVTTISCVAKKEKIPSLTSDQPPNWKKILSCESNALEIDLDTNDRRSIQVTVKDPDAFKTFDEKMPFGQIKEENSRIYRGQSGSGELKEPAQFSSVFESTRKLICSFFSFCLAEFLRTRFYCF